MPPPHYHRRGRFQQHIPRFLWFPGSSQSSPGETCAALLEGPSCWRPNPVDGRLLMRGSLARFPGRCSDSSVRGAAGWPQPAASPPAPPHPSSPARPPPCPPSSQVSPPHPPSLPGSSLCQDHHPPHTCDPIPAFRSVLRVACPGSLPWRPLPALMIRFHSIYNCLAVRVDLLCLLICSFAYHLRPQPECSAWAA